jgi:hypothetical protein
MNLPFYSPSALWPRGNPDRVDSHCASIAKLAQRHRRSRLRAPAASAAEAKRLGGLEVYYELEFGGPHDRQIGGFFALENPVDVNGSAFHQGIKVWPAGHQAAGLWKGPVGTAFFFSKYQTV